MFDKLGTGNIDYARAGIRVMARRTIRIKLKPALRHQWLSLVIALVLVFLCCPQRIDAATQSLIVVDKNRRISGTLQEISVAEALKKISEKLPLQITGSPPAELVRVRFEESTLQEAVQKIMRGYNYVLFDSGSSGVVLTIMGKAEREQGAGAPAPSTTASPAMDSQRPADDKGRGEGAGPAPVSPSPATSSPESAQPQHAERASTEPANVAPGPPPQPVERTPGPATSVPGPPPTEIKPEQNESPGSITKPDGSTNNEPARANTAEAANPGQSSPLGLLRKNTLDNYFNVKRS